MSHPCGTNFQIDAKFGPQRPFVKPNLMVGRCFALTSHSSEGRGELAARSRRSLPDTSLTESNGVMKRVTTILATALLASSMLTSAEARGDRDGSGIGAGVPPAGLRVAVGGIARAGMKRFGGNHIGRGDRDLDFYPHAMHHFGRFSPGYGVYDGYNPICHIEAIKKRD